MQWRVKPVLPVSKLMGAVAVVILAVAFAAGDPVRWALGGALAVALALWALRDLIAPVRLAADPSGVTVVTGFARRRRLPWDQLERVRVDRRTHRGLRSEMLELDAGDAIYLLSTNDLGAEPEEVAAALADLRLAPSSGEQHLGAHDGADQ
ncbi:PH domain-containing protein [Actinoplanes sp. NPDC049596]|uniref:PH domain-containing protein n=1 Tax=unclassified Actinoplanes TaxID=2626549 RepID=UPI0034238F2E